MHRENRTLHEGATDDEVRKAFARGRGNLKLRWTRPLLADLIEAQSYIAKDLPAAEVRSRFLEPFLVSH